MKKVLVIILSLLSLQGYAQNSLADKDYRQAESYFQSGQYDKAIECIVQYVDDRGDKEKASAFKKKVNECQAVYSKAETLFAAKKYQEALEQYVELERLNPTHPQLASKKSTCNYWISKSKNEQSSSSRSSQSTSSSAATVYQSPAQSSSSSSSSASRTKYKPSNPLEPEGFTMELGVIGGTNLGVSMDFTVSYFLIGLGVDWIMITPERTKTTSLVNSGYTGNFTKTTTINLSGTCTNVFLDLGGYFKYFSVSCQLGLLCGTTVDRTSLYSGSGYGLVDGDVNEYWGSYTQRSFSKSSSEKELHMTLTPQLKGYIPIGRRKEHSLSLGLGYTFIPTLGYNAGLSGNLGIHFRF